MGLLCSAICLSLHPTLDFASSLRSCLAAPLISSLHGSATVLVLAQHHAEPSSPCTAPEGPGTCPVGWPSFPGRLWSPSPEPAIAAGCAAAECAAPGAAVQHRPGHVQHSQQPLSAQSSHSRLVWSRQRDGQGTERQRTLFPHKCWLRRSAVGRGLESCIPPEVRPQESQSCSDQQQPLTGCLHPSASSLYRSRSLDFALVPIPAEHRTKAQLQLSSSAFTPTFFVKR